MVPAALGSDSGGSIRIPAAHCGIVGFRPSSGRLPDAGMVPLNHSRDAPGLLARSLRDIALLDEIVAGDSFLQPPRLEGLRIGLPRDYLFAELDPRVAAVIEAELDRLRALGVVFVEAAAPDFAALRAQAAGPITAWEMPRDVERYLKEVGIELSFAELAASVASPYVKSELEGLLKAAGPELDARYQAALSDVLPRHRAAYLAYFRDNGLAAMALPTSPLAPAPVGENDKVTVNGAAISIWHTLRNAIPATLLGAPGLSLPVGLTDDGLPVGLELDGLPGGDRALLSIGLAWEGASPGIPAPQL
jgi:mandelamide amidase